MDRKFLLFLKYYYTLASHTGKCIYLWFVAELQLFLPGIKRTGFKKPSGTSGRKKYTDFCCVASNTNKGIPRFVLFSETQFPLRYMPSSPRPHPKSKTKKVLPSFNTSILVPEQKHVCSSLTHSRPVFTWNSIPWPLLLAANQDKLEFPFLWLLYPPGLFWQRGKKSKRVDTQCSYLTQKYKTTGPDFLGKSCSKTLRSSWSQFKCPLWKRETSGLDLWVLPKLLGMKVYVCIYGTCWSTEKRGPLLHSSLLSSIICRHQRKYWRNIASAGDTV